MAEDWREFEKLVARIERAIGPVGGIVRSPDYVRDSVTGELREVDASIRTQEDVPPIRILECRDRARVEDVIWIEQLVTKSRDHGVATTAVSSKGFSRSATTKANHYGIETRQISELTQDEMLGWVKIKEVVHRVYFPGIESVKLEMYCEPGETVGKLHPNVIKQIKAGRGDAPVFIRHADGKAFTACQMLDAAVRKGLDLFTGVPDDGTKVRKQAAIKFEKGLCHVQTARGPRDLGKLVLGVDVHATNSSSSLPEKGFCYHGSGRPATYGIETEAEVLGNDILVSFHKQTDSDVLVVTITRQTDKQ
ncbi:MAG: hypothetical protein V3T84_04680 [Phycisphaerales bacterium]